MSAITGKFIASAVGAAFGADKGGNKIAIHLQIVDQGDHAGSHVAFVGNLDHDIGFEIAIKALRALGWSGDNIAEFAEKPIEVVAPNQVTIVCKQRAWIDDKGKDRTTTEVQVFPLGGGTHEFKDKLDARSVAALGAQLRSKIAGMRLPASKPATAETKATNEPEWIK